MASRNVDLIFRARDQASKAVNVLNSALEELTGVQKTVSAGSQEMSRALDAGQADARSLARTISGETTQAATKAAAAFDRINESVNKNRAQLQKQESALRETRDSYNALKAQAASAATAIERMSQGAARSGRILQAEVENPVKKAKAALAGLERQIASTNTRMRSQEQSVDAARASLQSYENSAIAAQSGLRGLNEAQNRAQTASRGNTWERAAAALTGVDVASMRAARSQASLAASARNVVNANSRSVGTAAQLGAELLRLDLNAQRAAGGMQRAAVASSRMKSAMTSFYGDTRRSLPLMQRLRGELISLTAQFAGFYAVFNTGGSFLTSFQTVEAAQNRFGAAFKQNSDAVRNEMSFLQAEAARLGFSFGTLSNEYSKFVISGQAAGLETDKLRRIFVQVTESARVLKLSNEQITGVLTAMTQIAGKGTLQMEELRQQLGDRLPGAVGIVAQALGYGEDRMAEFFKAVENGQIGAEEALVALGQGLSDTYGGQLDSALDSVTARIGTLQNLLFNRQVDAANAGFVGGLNSALDALNAFLESEDGIAFFESLGAAMGRFLKLIPVVIDNIDGLVFVLQALLAVKVARSLGQMAGGADVLNLAAARAAVGLMNMATSARALGVNGALAATRSIRLTTVLSVMPRILRGVAGAARTAWIALGGPIGLIIAAISFLATEVLGGLLFSVDGTTEALNRHEETINKVRDAYREADGDLTAFRENLDGLTRTELSLELGDLSAGLEDAENDFDKSLNRIENRLKVLSRRGGPVDADDLRLFQRLREQYENNEISVEDLQQAVDDLNRTYDETLGVSTLRRFTEASSALLEVRDATDRTEAAIRLLDGEMTEADAVTLDLTTASEELAASQGTVADQVADTESKLRQFDTAMRELISAVPELNAQMENFDAIAKIEQDFQNAIAAANALPEAVMRAAAAAEASSTRIQALQAANVSMATGGNIVDKIIGVESGGNATAQNPQSTARGLGQFIESTWLAQFRKHFPSQASSMSQSAILALRDDADISRQMVSLLVQDNAAALASGGNQATDPNLYLAHFLGAGGANKLLGSAPGTRADSLFSEDAISSNESILGNGATREDVIAWARRKMNISTEELAIVESIAEQEAKRAEEAQEFQSDLQRRLEIARQEAELASADVVTREVAKALSEAERDAAEAGVELTRAQREEIEAVTREKFKQQGLDEARNASLEQARALEEEISLLESQRQFLTEQRDYQSANGDVVGVAQSTQEIDEVNLALDSAIEKAIQFWEALGGEGSAAALQALRQTQAEMGRTAEKAVVTGEQINQSIATKMTAAFDRFSQRVANGENALQAFGLEFRQMAAEFLIEIAKMIMQQAILNAISGGSAGGGAGGFVSNIIGSLFHSGGIAGSKSGPSRSVNPAIFTNAARYHGGGIAGLRPDEVPAILQKGEETITKNDPRHRANGGLDGGGKAPNMRIVNMFEGSDVMEAALNTRRGEEVMLNWVRNNADAVKGAL